MVNFQETLLKHQRPGWRYVNYALLKRLIADMVAGKPHNFRKVLLAEIEAVSAFFVRVEKSLTEKAASYVVDLESPSARQLSQLSSVVQVRRPPV